jgi:hypothetical protein
VLRASLNLLLLVCANSLKEFSRLLISSDAQITFRLRWLLSDTKSSFLPPIHGDDFLMFVLINLINIIFHLNFHLVFLSGEEAENLSFPIYQHLLGAPPPLPPPLASHPARALLSSARCHHASANKCLLSPYKIMMTIINFPAKNFHKFTVLPFCFPAPSLG